jgi:ABC-2 type transport system permease protein
MSAFVAGLRFQLWSLHRGLDDLQAFLITPLLALIFGGIVISTGRRGLLPTVILGAGLMGMWMVCVQHGGEIIAAERSAGTFEALESTPALLRLVVLGRVTVVTAVTLLALPEAWLLALVVFRTPIGIPHPALFAAAVLLVLAGLHATAILFAAMFVLARNALVMQNAMAYPIYLLGGLLVPVSVLPGWLQAVSRLIFLSWGSDLLRAALSPVPPADVGGRLIALAVTVAALAAIGQVVFGMVLRRSRINGTMSLV